MPRRVAFAELTTASMAACAVSWSGIGASVETSGTSNFVPANDSYLSVPRKVDDCDERLLWLWMAPISGRRENSMACACARSDRALMGS